MTVTTRLDRVAQYSRASRSIADALGYWIAGSSRGRNRWLGNNTPSVDGGVFTVGAPAFNDYGLPVAGGQVTSNPPDQTGTGNDIGGVPEADIGAAINDPETMKGLLNQLYGRRSMIAPGDDRGSFGNKFGQATSAAGDEGFAHRVERSLAAPPG